MSSIPLKKGQSIPLQKTGEPEFTKISVRLGWDENKFTGGGKFDVDVSCFALEEDDKGYILKSAEDFCYYYKNSILNGAIIHSGDEKDGSKAGDDEIITIDLSKIPESKVNLSFVVTIDEAAERKQNFGMIQNSYARVVNEANGEELYRFDLAEDFSVETAIQYLSIYRNNGKWKLKAIGAGFSGTGLQEFISSYRYVEGT
jgi:tellurium resistance protein TerD